MKNKMKISMIAALSLSAITPVMSLAAEEVKVPSGFYDTKEGGFIEVNSFIHMSLSKKLNILQNSAFYYLDGTGNALQVTNIIESETDDILLQAVKTVEEVQEELDVVFVPNGVEIKPPVTSPPTPPVIVPPTPPVVDDSLEELTTNVDSLSMGIEKSVDFRVLYTGKEASELTLLKKIGNTFVPYNNDGHINLRDNGNQENADLLHGDGIYSARVLLNGNQEGIQTFAVGIEVDGKWKVVSKPIEIMVVIPFTEKQAQQITEKTTNLQEEIEKLKDEGKTIENVKADVVNTLNESADVSKAGVSEAGVWFALKSGALGAVTVTDSAPVTVISHRALEMNVTDIEKNMLANTDASSTVGNQRVIILTGHGSSGSDGATLASMLQGSSIPFTVNHYKNATVEEFKSMFNYGTIVFDTAGAALFKGDFTTELPYLSDLFKNIEEQVVILTGEPVTMEQTLKYNADIKTGRLVTVDGYYAITPAFVKYYGGKEKLPQSLVYANSAYSHSNATLANQFIKKGAQSYIGSKESIETGNMLNSFGSLLKGKTLLESLGQSVKITGNKSLSYAKTASLVNGNLEGKDGWISGGHFDSITHLGVNLNERYETIKPTEGQRMGIISSGVDETALDGRQSWVYQTFYVPEEMNSLKFDYNVVSNEPMVYIGSQYDDTFKATIVEGTVKEPKEGEFDSELEGNYNGIYNAPWLSSTVDVDEKVISYESINSSDWGQDYDDDRQRVDIVLPSGDSTTYMTGWKTLTYDVSEYKGKTITLKLQTWDLGDKSFPTAVLFDKVHLTNSIKSGAMIRGVNEVFIPEYGVREYQFNTLYYDQFNDPVTSDISMRLNDRGYRQPVMEQIGKFSLKESIEGIEINANSGLLKVSNQMVPTEITVIAEVDKEKVEHKVQITKSVKKTGSAEELLGKIEDHYILPYGTTNSLETMTAELQSIINDSSAELVVKEVGDDADQYIIVITKDGHSAQKTIKITIATEITMFDLEQSSEDIIVTFNKGITTLKDVPLTFEGGHATITGTTDNSNQLVVKFDKELPNNELESFALKLLINHQEVDVSFNKKDGSWSMSGIGLLENHDNQNDSN
ncbi:hypothetical protein CSV69_10175 [Sporosarcina sp. P26b]|uniref:hypothetical protein n=1 Tax=Sporosarcina sp. P26b TaxID=2048253 RepID=UPI000C162DF5|nr:hypothetical protein [Sporosarcina sp. P26b]PIC95697.1 hypothetical protein CSV69_10175 [Sporosarcina sp. P26b]